MNGEAVILNDLCAVKNHPDKKWIGIARIKINTT